MKRAEQREWLARYLIEVDENKTTLRFRQEIYNDQGELVEMSKCRKIKGIRRYRLVP